MRLASIILGLLGFAYQGVSQTNFIQNGDFQANSLGTSDWTIRTSLTGWEVKQVEQGKGSVYNGKWGNRIVIQLDGNQNDFIRQKINLDRGQYIVQIDYAARAGSVQTSGMSVYWNGKKIISVEGEDEEIHTLKIPLLAFTGVNSLEIGGEGTNDGYGMTITNVMLIKNTSNSNFVRNGQFQQNFLGSKDWVITNSLPWWQVGKQVEQGKGSVYNAKWGNRIVVELDSNQNDVLRQAINLDSGYYILSLEYAARAGHVQTSAMAISWNGCQVTAVQGKDEAIHTLNILVKTCQKTNTLQIAGKGASDSYGMTITNVSLYKLSK